jgi:hypothetical protein
VKDKNMLEMAIFLMLSSFMNDEEDDIGVNCTI